MTAAGSGDPDENGQLLWTKMAKRPFPLAGSRDVLAVGAPELFASLALCKRLEDMAEPEVIAALSDEKLAAIVVDDRRSAPRRFAKDRGIAKRLDGFRRREYPGFASVDAHDLLDARERPSGGG